MTEFDQRRRRLREERARLRRQRARRAERIQRGREARRELRRASKRAPPGPAPDQPAAERGGETNDAGGGPHAPLRRRLVLGAALVVASALFVVLQLGARDAVAGPATRVSAAIANPLDTPARLEIGRWLGALRGPPRVGIQIGHLDAARHPDELARLRWSTGGSADGITEVAVNEAVAEALADRLVAAGVDVDLLPATLPPNYRADALIALHADSSPDPARRGYKSAHFEPPRNRSDPALKATVDAAYLNATGLPDDHRNVSGNMLRYYAFNRRFRHAAARSTPAVLVEMGYISNPGDRALLLEPDHVARALADGLTDYLRTTGRLSAEAAELALRDAAHGRNETSVP